MGLDSSPVFPLGPRPPGSPPVAINLSIQALPVLVGTLVQVAQ
jgi:hypothetical protein